MKTAGADEPIAETQFIRRRQRGHLRTLAGAPDVDLRLRRAHAGERAFERRVAGETRRDQRIELRIAERLPPVRVDLRGPRIEAERRRRDPRDLRRDVRRRDAAGERRRGERDTRERARADHSAASAIAGRPAPASATFASILARSLASELTS